jgi:phosphatidylinositol kinase/protein kinase (PI-3  family)
MISPFSDLSGHKLVHFMVKTEDDLRQEAFAMQLLE